MGNYFQYLILEYQSGIKHHLSGKIKGKLSLSHYKKGKQQRAYMRETVRNYLIGDKRVIGEDFLKRNIWPAKISLKYRSIPVAVFRILLNQRLQRTIELMALTREYSITTIAEHVNRFYHLSQPLSAQVISKYLYFFWNVLPSDSEGLFDPIRIVQFLTSNKQLSKIYSDHIEVALGKQSPLEVAIRFGFNEKVASHLNEEVYSGFAMAVVRKNQAVLSDRMEEADVYSKIMVRDSQVLRNLGHKPKKKALRDSVNVIYD